MAGSALGGLAVITKGCDGEQQGTVARKFSPRDIRDFAKNSGRVVKRIFGNFPKSAINHGNRKSPMHFQFYGSLAMILCYNDMHIYMELVKRELITHCFRI